MDCFFVIMSSWELHIPYATIECHSNSYERLQ